MSPATIVSTHIRNHLRRAQRVPRPALVQKYQLGSDEERDVQAMSFIENPSQAILPRNASAWYLSRNVTGLSSPLDDLQDPPLSSTNHSPPIKPANSPGAQSRLAKPRPELRRHLSRDCDSPQTSKFPEKKRVRLDTIPPDFDTISSPQTPTFLSLNPSHPLDNSFDNEADIQVAISTSIESDEPMSLAYDSESSTDEEADFCDFMLRDDSPSFRADISNTPPESSLIRHPESYTPTAYSDDILAYDVMAFHSNVTDHLKLAASDSLNPLVEQCNASDRPAPDDDCVIVSSIDDSLRASKSFAGVRCLEEPSMCSPLWPLYNLNSDATMSEFDQVFDLPLACRKDSFAQSATEMSF